MMQTVRSAIPLLIIGAIALIGAIVLAGLKIGVPPELWAIAFAALTGGSVATVPHPPAVDAAPPATTARGR